MFNYTLINIPSPSCVPYRIMASDHLNVGQIACIWHTGIIDLAAVGPLCITLLSRCQELRAVVRLYTKESVTALWLNPSRCAARLLQV